MNKKKAVLFDYDGVLVDTMEDMYMAWSKAISKYSKKKISRNLFYLLEGKPARKMAEALFTKYNISHFLIEEVIKKKEEIYFKTYHENSKHKLNKKLLKAINFLKDKDVLIGLVSGAPLSRIRKTLPPAVFEKFNVVVAADNVRQGKPHPEPYLTAVRKLKVKKINTIVVENAPLGIEAALAAGLFCIAVESTLHRRHLKNAQRVIIDFDEMFVYFRSNF